MAIHEVGFLKVLYQATYQIMWRARPTVTFSVARRLLEVRGHMTYPASVGTFLHRASLGQAAEFSLVMPDFFLSRQRLLIINVIEHR